MTSNARKHSIRGAVAVLCAIVACFAITAEALTPNAYVYSNSQTYTASGVQGTFTITGVSGIARSYRASIDAVTGGTLAWSGACNPMQVKVGWGNLGSFDGEPYITPQWTADGSFTSSSAFTFTGVTLPWATGSNVHYFISFECSASDTGILFYDFFTVTDCSTSAVNSIVTTNSVGLPWVAQSNGATITVQNGGVAPLYNMCGATAANWSLTLTDTSGLVTYATMVRSSFSTTNMLFSEPSSFGPTPGTSYVARLHFSLWNTTFVLGTIQVVVPQLTKNAMGRYYGWNTFDYNAGGELVLFGSGFGPSCAAGQWQLKSTTTARVFSCSSVDPNGNFVVFAVPPSPTSAIGYDDTYVAAYATQSPSPPAALTSTPVPVVYGFGHVDHYEEVIWNLTWSGPWSGAAVCPVRIIRKGALVALSLVNYPFTGGTYVSSAVISSIGYIPERFRPSVTKKRCHAHVRFGGDGYDLHMDVSHTGQLWLYKDSTGSDFTSTPNIYPATCLWDMSW